MAWERLETDEVIEGNAKPSDPEMKLFGGFMTFAFLSVALFALQIWPFFVIYDLQVFANLSRALQLGLIPTAIAGILACLFLGLPGASAFVSGALSGAIFLLLRMLQITSIAGKGPIEPLDYAPSLGWMIPVGWALAAIVLTVVTLPRRHYRV